MFGRRSLSLELLPYDPEIERTIRKGIEKPDSQITMGENLETKTLREYFAPITTNSPSCIVLPNTTAAHFELKPQILQLLPNFHGLDREDPYMHVKEFLDICSTFKFQNFSDESVRLRLFPFSLKDKAKGWLNSQPPGSITSWDELVRKFLSKFFPMSRTNSLRRNISDFRQKDDEQFYESWERFKDLILRCPHHGFETWRLVQYFYNGLTQSNRHMIESMKGGAFLSLRDDEAYEFLENLSENSQQWDFSNQYDRQVKEPKRGGMYEVRSGSDLEIKIESLSRKVEALALDKTMSSVNQVQSEGCSLCASPMHSAQTCPSMCGYSESHPEQINALNNFRKPFGTAFSEPYNPNWRNHPNFSWRTTQPQLNFGGNQNSQNNQFRPPNQPYHSAPQSNPQFAAPQPQQSSLEESLQKFMQVTGQAISKLEQQIGQLATVVGEREKGKFPSQPLPNPKGQFQISEPSSSLNSHEQVQSIATLRSGKQVDNKVQMPDLDEDAPTNKSKDGEAPISSDNHSSSVPKIQTFPVVEQPVRNYVLKALFPQRLVKKTEDGKYRRYITMLK